MTRSIFITGIAALALTGCNGTTVPNASIDTAAETNAADNASAAGNVAATVLGYSDRERNGVLARAIIDAKMPCDGVIKSDRMGDQSGMPAWRATCKNGYQHLVSISPDGVATILSRSDR